MIAALVLGAVGTVAVWRGRQHRWHAEHEAELQRMAIELANLQAERAALADRRLFHLGMEAAEPPESEKARWLAEMDSHCRALEAARAEVLGDAPPGHALYHRLVGPDLCGE